MQRRVYMATACCVYSDTVVNPVQIGKVFLLYRIKPNNNRPKELINNT